MTKSTKAKSADIAPVKTVRKRGRSRKDADTTRIDRPPALVADDRTLRQLRKLGEIQCTVREAAGVLLVGESTLEQFLGTSDPQQAREAF